MRKVLLGLAAAVMLTGSASSLRAVPPDNPVDYRVVDGTTLRLYVTSPQSTSDDARHPAIVFFHGGGWVGGKPGQFTEHAKHFSARGFVCVQVQYRLLKGSKTAPPDPCILDARASLHWVHEHADELGIDRERIAVGGGSAGGHLATAMGTNLLSDKDPEDGDIRPDAMLLFNPVFDNGPGGWGTQRVGDRYPELSPMHNLDQHTPPAVVFLGDQDKLIPVETLDRFRQKMEALEIPVRTVVFPGEGHGFFNHGRGDNSAYTKTIAECTQFLQKLGWMNDAEQAVVR